MTAPAPAKRSRRKPRVPGGRAAFTVITPRDASTFAALLDYRFLTLAQIARLVPRDAQSKSIKGHEKKLRERLGELFHAGYVHRTRTQAYPSVYALGADGADHLRVGDEDFNRVEWLKKKTATWHFIEHAVETAEFRILVREALTPYRAVRLVTGRPLIHAIRQATKPRPGEHPLLLRQPVTLDLFDSRAGKTLGDTQHAGTVPDHLFLLQLPDGSQRGFAVEIDRGTMPVTHRGFTGSSIEKKMRVYSAAQQSRVDADRWGMSNFRVLLITPHPKRSASIRALCKSLGTDVAWTAEQGSLTAKTMLAAFWQNLHGKAHGLVPPIFME